MLWTNTEAARLVRNGTDGRGGLVAVWPRLAGGRTRAVVMPSLDGHEACVGVLVQGFPFMAAASLQRSFSQSVSGVDNTELDNGQPVRFRRREYGCGKDGGVASRRRTVVTLMMMRFNGPKN
jgi:hypothetical protein